MKNRIIRAKKFVTDHSHGIAATAGLVVGATVTYRYLNPNQVDVVMELSKSQVTRLLENPDNCVSYDLPKQMVHVVINPEL